MADQFFVYGGNLTYMVGKASPLDCYPEGLTNDDRIWYRAKKRFWAYVDKYGVTGYTPRVTVTVVAANGKNMRFYLRKFENHMSTSASTTIDSGTFTSGSVTCNFNSNGLWRIDCDTEGDLMIFRVRVHDVQYSSIDCIEPSLGFYITGAYDDPYKSQLVRRYFFVPNGVTPRIMLRTENAGCEALLKVYKVVNGVDTLWDITADDKQATEDGKGVLLCKGNYDPHPVYPEGQGRRYFQEGIINVGGSTSPSGSIFAFEIESPRESGKQPATSQVWVRFFRYVPQYFANDPRRLLIPAVHPYYQNVSYGSKSVTCRAFLGFNRGDIGGWANNATLKIQVGTNEASTSSGYSASVVFTTPSVPAPANKQTLACTSTLKDGDTLKAKGTDMVDNMYVVLNSDQLSWNPSPWTGWPSRIHAMFDDMHGKYASDLATRNFHVVQICSTAHLSAINGATTQDGYQMKAFGALYAGNADWQSWYQSNWNHLSILFWDLRDEPDFVTTLKTLCEDYYARKGNTTKPISVTLQHAQYYREYALACDILIIDPYSARVNRRHEITGGYWEIPPPRESHQEKISDFIKGAIQAISYESTKRLICTIWAYGPLLAADWGLTGVPHPGQYEVDWNKVKDAMPGNAQLKGIATFKYGRTDAQSTEWRIPGLTYQGTYQGKNLQDYRPVKHPNGTDVSPLPPTGVDLWNKIEDLQVG